MNAMKSSRRLLALDRFIISCSVTVALSLTAFGVSLRAQSCDILPDGSQTKSQTSSQSDLSQEKDQTGEKKDDKKDEKNKKDEKKGLPLKSDRKISFTTDEGTWLSLDVSPDAKSKAARPS